MLTLQRKHKPEISEEILQLLIPFRSNDALEIHKLCRLEGASLKHPRWDIYGIFWVVPMTVGLLEVNGSEEGSSVRLNIRQHSAEMWSG